MARLRSGKPGRFVRVGRCCLLSILRFGADSTLSILLGVGLGSRLRSSRGSVLLLLSFLLWVRMAGVRLGRPLWVCRVRMASRACCALALYFASIEGEHAPDVIVAAGSRDQAAVVFDQARSFAGSDPIIDLWFDQQRFVMKCAESDGLIRRIAADGKLQHGLNPSTVIVDELHSFSTPRQVELWAAMQTATGARELPFTCSITTAGYDKTTILGQLLQSSDRLAAARGPRRRLPPCCP
jgi:hypothetical protein